MGTPLTEPILVSTGRVGNTTKYKAEAIPVMDFARKLAEDVQAGKITADKATRLLISRLSYYRPDRIPTYSAKLISAASDLIYAAEMKSPSYHDPATDEAMRILRDAAMEARSGK